MTYLVLSEITVNLTDLVNILLGLVGIVVLIFLAMFLFNLSSMFKKIKNMLDDLALPISHTVNQLPEVMKKADKSLGDVNTITEAAATSIPEILDDVSAVGGTVKTVADTATNIVDGVDGAVTGLKSGVGHVTSNIDFKGLVSLVGKVTAVLSFFKKRKKQKKKN